VASDGRICSWNVKTNLTTEARRQLAALAREITPVTLQDARRLVARELPTIAEITRNTDGVSAEGVKSLRTWLLSDWRQRPLSPFDKVTPRMCIDRLLSEGTPESIEEAGFISAKKDVTTQ